MLLDCQFCGEAGIELDIGKVATPWNPLSEYEDSIIMKCVSCGVQEPCESEDLIGFMMQIVGEDSFAKAMVKTLKILWKNEVMQDVKE